MSSQTGSQRYPKRKRSTPVYYDSSWEESDGESGLDHGDVEQTSESPSKKVCRSRRTVR